MHMTRLQTLSSPVEKYMKHATLLIFAFLVMCGNPESVLAASESDLWSPTLQANVDRLVKNGIPKDEITSITQSMVKARFTEETIIGLQNTVMQAFAHGVPIAPVNSKILEGIAKHAPPSSIVLATERITARYIQSSGLAAQLTEENEQKTQWGEFIATGNAAGLAFQDVEKILQQLQTRKNEKYFNSLTTETLVTARDMSRQSVPPESLTEIISLAITKGFNAEQMRELNRSFSILTQQNSLATVTQNCIANLQKRTSPKEALHDFSSGKGQGNSSSQGSSSSGSGSSQGTSTGSSNSKGSDGSSGGNSEGKGSNGTKGNGSGNGRGNS